MKYKCVKECFSDRFYTVGEVVYGDQYSDSTCFELIEEDVKEKPVVVEHTSETGIDEVIETIKKKKK